jgi:hypothetical protein
LGKLGRAQKDRRGAWRERPSFLHVKVRENWLDDPERYQAMGLEFPTG